MGGKEEKGNWRRPSGEEGGEDERRERRPEVGSISIQRGLASTDAIAIGKIRLIREAMMTEHASISLSSLANKHLHSRHIAFTLYATVHNVRWAILLEFWLKIML